ncbi:MAG: hypothetical protein AB7S69_14715 [Salinivirgaceae bacterium]
MKKRLLFLVLLPLIALSCESKNSFSFIGKWQSLNDESSLIEFTKDNKITLYRNGKSFWAQSTLNGELNCEISKQSDRWYKFVAFDGTDVFIKGRIEIVADNRIRIYFHKHHDILDVADEYYQTDDFNNHSKIMKEIMMLPEVP